MFDRQIAAALVVIVIVSATVCLAPMPWTHPGPAPTTDAIVATPRRLVANTSSTCVDFLDAVENRNFYPDAPQTFVDSVNESMERQDEASAARGCRPAVSSSALFTVRSLYKRCAESQIDVSLYSIAQLDYAILRSISSSGFGDGCR